MKLKLYFFVLLAIALSSCSPRSVYIPLSQNVPLFNRDKQLNTNIYLGLNHIEMQLAHNPVKHLAVAANVNFGSGLAIYDAAIGYYSYNKSAAWRYEIFAGYGYNTNITYPSTKTNFFTKETVTYNVNAAYDKYYLQPSIGYFNNIKMYKLKYSFSLSSRVSFNHFKSFKYAEIDKNATTDPNAPIYKVNKTYSDKDLLLLEPCLTNKVGIKNLYGIIQVQAMIPYSEQIDVRDTKFSPGILLSLGLQYNFVFKKHNYAH